MNDIEAAMLIADLLDRLKAAERVVDAARKVDTKEYPALWRALAALPTEEPE